MMMLVTLLLLAASLGGCVAVAGNTLHAAQRRYPVYADGKVYVVDVYSGTVMHLPAEALEQAGPFRPIPCDDD